MKSVLSLLVLLILSLSTHAGTGGTSGGNHQQLGNSQPIVTVWDCNGGESGTQCRWIRFKYRPPTEAPAKPPQCVIGYGEVGERPCPASFGPFLQNLNEYFFNQYNSQNPDNQALTF